MFVLKFHDIVVFKSDVFGISLIKVFVETIEVQTFLKHCPFWEIFQEKKTLSVLL